MGGKKEIYRDVRFFHGSTQLLQVMLYPVSQKNKQDTLLSPITLEILTDFQNTFTSVPALDQDDQLWFSNRVRKAYLVTSGFQIMYMV